MLESELFIIPCCATKASGGLYPTESPDPLQSFVSHPTYKNILVARREVLSRLNENPKYLVGKNLKNINIVDGPDFGTHGADGKYLAAVKRHRGKLYSPSVDFIEGVRQCVADAKNPKILILSALYGPLHPFSCIQDYNLKMTESPASRVWKHYFPTFLEDYVSNNRISRIRLYLGGSTGYYKVAKYAIELLKSKSMIDSVIHYELKNGNSFSTPTIHGRLALAHMMGLNDREAEQEVRRLEI